MMTDGHQLTSFQKSECITLDLIILKILTDSVIWDTDYKVKRPFFNSVCLALPLRCLPPSEMFVRHTWLCHLL